MWSLVHVPPATSWRRGGGCCGNAGAAPLHRLLNVSFSSARFILILGSNLAVSARSPVIVA